MTAKHIVAKDSELTDGDYIGVHLEGREIGIFKVDGEYYAYTSWCPHQSGPVCDREISGTIRAEFDAETLTQMIQWTDNGCILLCPWHH